MEQKRDGGRLVSLPSGDFEALLERAAETGARRALHVVGPQGEDAALDIRDLRSLSECIRFVRRTAVRKQCAC